MKVSKLTLIISAKVIAIKYPIIETMETKKKCFQCNICFLNRCPKTITLDVNVMKRVASHLVQIASKQEITKNIKDNFLRLPSLFSVESPVCRKAQELITPRNAHERGLSCGRVLMSTGTIVKVQDPTTACRTLARVM